jgi:5-methylcytosine-specific restriction endonuclease McrA
MPINYKDYPINWKSEIRPAILKRANNKCEFCGIPNGIWAFRGRISGNREVYQTVDGDIFNADNSELIHENLFDIEITPTGKDTAIKIVLTIAHLDHDTTNNEYSNLKALCQRCHNRYDRSYRTANVKAKNENKKGLVKLF